MSVKDKNSNPGAAAATAKARADEPAKSRAVLNESATAGNVDRIRDILFGSQMRDYEKKFSRIEEAVQKESAALREDTRKRLDALEAYFKKELDSLGERLKSERGERTQSVAKLSADWKATGDSLAKKIADLDESRSEDVRNLRSELLKQSSELLEAIQSRNDALSTLLDRRLEELRDNKVDRAALAEMMTEVAMRLNDEFHIPGDER